MVRRREETGIDAERDRAAPHLGSTGARNHRDLDDYPPQLVDLPASLSSRAQESHLLCARFEPSISEARIPPCLLSFAWPGSWFSSCWGTTCAILVYTKSTKLTRWPQMGDGVRVWEVGVNDCLGELTLTKMDREDRIEKWISENVSVLAPDDSGL